MNKLTTGQKRCRIFLNQHKTYITNYYITHNTIFGGITLIYHLQVSCRLACPPPILYIAIGWIYATPDAKKFKQLSLFDGFWPPIFLLITFQRFPLGFMSGDLAMTVLMCWFSIPIDQPGCVKWSLVLLEKPILTVGDCCAEANFLWGPPCTLLDSCVLHKGKCAVPDSSLADACPDDHQSSIKCHSWCTCRPHCGL